MKQIKERTAIFAVIYTMEEEKETAESRSPRDGC
jgi:hypothetical protein